MQRQDEYEKAKSSMFRAEEEHLSSSSGLVKNLNRQLEKKRRLEEEALQKVIIFFVIYYYWISNNLLRLQFSYFNLHQDHLEGLLKQTAGLYPQNFWFSKVWSWPQTTWISNKCPGLLLLLLLGIHTLRTIVLRDFCYILNFGVYLWRKYLRSIV